MTTLLLSTTVIAAFVGGILALVAPCCISVILPAVFASPPQDQGVSGVQAARADTAATGAA